MHNVPYYAIAYMFILLHCCRLSKKKSEYFFIFQTIPKRSDTLQLRMHLAYIYLTEIIITCQSIFILKWSYLLLANDGDCTLQPHRFSPRGVKINQTPPTHPTTTILSTFGDRFCPLIASSNYCHTLSIMDPNTEIVMMVRRKKGPLFSLKFRLCLQIDSVWMNKHQLCKTSYICILSEERPIRPFPLPAAAQNKISFTTERAASYYHHYQHQHNSGCKSIMHFLFCCSVRLYGLLWSVHPAFNW